MRGVRVRICCGMLLMAVSLCWVQAYELDESSRGQSSPKQSPQGKSVRDSLSSYLANESDRGIDGENKSNQGLTDKLDIGNKIQADTRQPDEQIETIKREPNRSEQIEEPLKGKSSTKQDASDDLEKDSQERKRLVGLDNRIVDRIEDIKQEIGEGSVSHRRPSSNSGDIRPDSGQREPSDSFDSQGDSKLEVTNRNTNSSNELRDTRTDGVNRETAKNVVDDREKSVPSSTRRLDSASTEPIPAESKVYREFSSRRFEERSFPFVTTARGSGVMTSTTSRSTKVEEVTVFSGEDEEDEADAGEEIKEKKKKPTSGAKELSTTLRTGKILAGQIPYDGLSGQSSGNVRKSAFQSHTGEYNPQDSYAGGIHRKPVTSYYESAMPGLPSAGGRKPSPFEARKPLYSLDSSYGGGGQRRPSSPYPSYPGEAVHSTPPYLRKPPGQDFSIGPAGKNPFLTGGGSSSILPSLSGITPSIGGGAHSSRRPYGELGTTGKVPFSGLAAHGEGLSAFANGGSELSPRPDVSVRIRKPSGLAGEPFSRPSSLNRPELEGGFKPLLATDYGGLPSQQQVYKQRVKPQRGPQGEGSAAVNSPGANPFNFNNIGLNMLYKETNVLNNQDFTSNGGGVDVSSSSSPHPSSSSPLTLAGDSNLLELSGTTAVNEGDADQGGSGALAKKINRTRVRQSTPPTPLGDVEQDDATKRPASNKPDDSLDVTTTDTIPLNPTQPTKYKLRKPSLLNNITRKGVESNAIPQEITSRKPVVKNNLKSRLGPSRTKVPSTTIPPPITTTLLAGTTDLDEDMEVEMEITTQLPTDSTPDAKPNAVKPIIGFNQRKRPPGKHSYPIGSGEVSTTLPPVKVSPNTRLRKPSQQAAFTTEPPSTPAPVKKIKPFVNWASRLQQKGTTTEDGSSEVSTVSDEDLQTEANPQGGVTSTAPSYALNTSTSFTSEPPYMGLTPVSIGTTSESSDLSGLSQSTTQSAGGEATTAKLFENTIPSKIGVEEKDTSGDGTRSKYSKVSGHDESKKEDIRFTVKDFISKFNEDSSGNSMEQSATFGHSIPGTNETITSETPLTPLSEAPLTMSGTSSPSPSFDDQTTHSTTQANHLTTAQTTLPNVSEQTTRDTPAKTTTETIVGASNASPVDKPPVESTSETGYDTSLGNVDMSGESSAEQSSRGEETTKIEKTVNEQTSESEKSHNVDSATNSSGEFTPDLDKENTGSSAVDVRTNGPQSGNWRTNETKHAEIENEKTENIIDIGGLLDIGNATTSTLLDINNATTSILLDIGNATTSTLLDIDNATTSTLLDIGNATTSTEANEGNIRTSENTSQVDSTRSEVPIRSESESKKSEGNEVLSRIPTSAEEGPKGGATDTSVFNSRTPQEHSTTGQSTTVKHKPSDPWRTEFSDDFWSKFESTTENWSPSAKTTLATPWLDENPVSPAEKEIEEDSNPVLSSVSVTPPTEGTTRSVAITTAKQSTKKSGLTTPKTSTPSTVLTTGREESSSVTMETSKPSSTRITMPTSTQTTTTSTVLPPHRYDLPTSEGDFYSEDMGAGSPPMGGQPAHMPPFMEDPKHYIQLAIHSTPADICASLPSLGQATIALFQYGSMRVQSAEQMRVKNRDLLCTSPDTKESLLFVEFFLTDGVGEFDRDINEEFLRLYNKHGGLDTDLMITDAHLIGEEPLRDEVFVSEDAPTSRPETPPRVIAAIVIATVAAVCVIIILVLLFIMRKKGRSFNNRQRCIPVSLDDYSLDNVSVYNSSRRKSRMRASKRSYGNPAFDDPNVPSNLMAFATLANFSRDSRAIEEEYANIPTVSVRPDELPPGVEDKNRYANVIPIPETRVRLCAPGEAASAVDDYINANYVRGPKNEEKFYIACQAPLQHTIEDFWHMVWTHQSRVILMITALFENSVEKCADYLPPSEVLDCHRVFGDYQITLKRREVREKYVISNLQIKNLETNLWRELTHVWYTSWPTTGVPSEENSLIAFLIEARAHTKSGGGGGSSAPPLVVHCSPGTGRTGTVLACDLLIRQFETSRSVDVPGAVYRIRRCRAGAVATPQQYAFVYRVLNVYATKLTGGALDSI